MIGFILTSPQIDENWLMHYWGISKPRFDTLFQGSGLPTKVEFRNIYRLFRTVMEKATRERLKTLAKLRYYKNQIAAAMGVEPSSVNRYETGETVPTHSHLLKDHIDLSKAKFVCSKANHMGPTHKAFAEAALENAKRKPFGSLKMGNGLQFCLHVFRVDFEDDSDGHVFMDLTTSPPEFFILLNAKLDDQKQKDVFLSELIGHVLQEMGLSRMKRK
jgi:transcriptional regulator with XRE-family HTH domain